MVRRLGGPEGGWLMGADAGDRRGLAKIAGEGAGAGRGGHRDVHWLYGVQKPIAT